MIFNEKQLEGYRKMSGEQRVLIALGLSSLIRNTARVGILNQHPEYNEEDVEKELRRRIDYGRTRFSCPYCRKT